ncbi:hypothetical protein AAFC00_006331 [Neodothiora populina]|uniref:DUF1752-domain-containing protein n=1 Tax=Neodothiora populina TaxID=2781224 RepID=A0ABR3P4U9_9PEZI
MPFRPQHSLLKIDVDKMHTIDTRSVEDLFGMWSVFSRISDAMEDGKRLENLSWRLWNRETFCCSPQTGRCQNLPTRAKHIPVPALSSSVSSSDSDFDEGGSPPSPIVRPELRRSNSSEHRSRGHEKHITPIDLEKMVISIQEKKNLEPLPSFSLPVSASQHDLPSDSTPTATRTAPPSNVELSVGSLAPTGPLLDSSTSDIGSTGSNPSGNMVSSESSSTDVSTHEIVRGFEPMRMSSYRSQTQLAAAPTPILKTSPQHRQETPPKPSLPRSSISKKKGATFTLGGSSGEDESSLDSHMGKNISSLSRSIHKPINKHTSFKDIVNSRAITESPVFEESDDEDDEDDDGYENVIEDDDEDEDSSDWEDDAEDSGSSSVDERSLFKRVDSRPSIASRRSMLTTMMHEPDRAKALANAASRSSPALRRSRQTSPNGPSATPPPRMQEYTPLQDSAPSKPQPIMVNTPQGQQLALSPRTTRRNMLSTELTESLRKNLLWERQHKSSNNLAAMKRRHTSNDIKNLKQHPEPAPIMSMIDSDKKNFSNEYFHQGLQEYHAKGW